MSSTLYPVYDLTIIYINKRPKRESKLCSRSFYIMESICILNKSMTKFQETVAAMKFKFVTTKADIYMQESPKSFNKKLKLNVRNFENELCRLGYNDRDYARRTRVCYVRKFKINMHAPSDLLCALFGSTFVPRKNQWKYVCWNCYTPVGESEMIDICFDDDPPIFHFYFAFPDESPPTGPTCEICHRCDITLHTCDTDYYWTP